jgi:hypothetical protein
MSRVSASRALAYATGEEMLKLYGVLVGAWVLTVVGQIFWPSPRSSIVSLIGFLVVLAGVFTFLVGVVAIAHKLLVESRTG